MANKNIAMIILATGMVITAGTVKAGDFHADIKEMVQGIQAGAVPPVKGIEAVRYHGDEASKETQIKEVPISKCYIAKPPIFRLAADGQQYFNVYNQADGTYRGQSLTYSYQQKEEILLVIDSGYGNITTRNITRITPQVETFNPAIVDNSNVDYVTRNDFAQRAFTSFNNLYADLMAAACEPAETPVVTAGQ